jgi:membrane protein YqaA with SNARE-associated domain
VGIGFVLLVVAIGLLSYFFRQPLIALSKRFVDAFGGFGVAVGWFLVDGLTVPLPNDAFSFFGLQGGISFWVVIAWSMVGSIAGGILAYGIGLLLRRNQRFIRFMEGPGSEAYQLVRRYGLLAVFIAALTPIPYSLASYACGVVRANFFAFLVISLARLPRIWLYLWIIQKGMITFAP